MMTARRTRIIRPFFLPKNAKRWKITTIARGVKMDRLLVVAAAASS